MEYVILKKYFASIPSKEHSELFLYSFSLLFFFWGQHQELEKVILKCLINKITKIMALFLGKLRTPKQGWVQWFHQVDSYQLIQI